VAPTAPKQLVLDRTAIEAAAPPIAEIVDIVENTYRMDAEGGVESPTKIGVHPDHPHSFLHAMPAWVSGGGALGVKWISYYPGNTERGWPDSSGLIVLNDPEHGLPVAIMEGMWITLVRTAACGAVAARKCIRHDPKRLGLVGCGGLGEWTVRVFGAIFPSIEEIRVASRTEASRNRFCDKMSSTGSWTLRPVDRLEDAVSDMDIVVSSVPQGTERPLKGAWWTPGTIAVPLDVLSAWDDAAFAQLDRLVTDNYEGLEGIVRQRRPDLKLPRDWVSFADIVTGRSPARLNPEERIMAIPTGVASVDINLAWEIYRRARDAGAGVEIALLS
jgi:alanine dehydrogenase